MTTLACIHSRARRARLSLLTAIGLTFSLVTLARPAAAADQIYFSATTNVTNILVQKINAETVRLDISSWYLSEHSVSIAIANRWAAGVPVRIIGDRAAIFEDDPHTKTEFYWLANQGIPIRLRYNPTYYPEIDHWKAAIFAGQNLVEFGSGNFAPTELAPNSSTDYDDDSEMFTDDPDLVKSFKAKFDTIWNDTTREPESIYSGPPYLKNWNDACALESACSDYQTQYPNPAPMNINTARLEPDYQAPADLIWGQGPDFNNRITQEINNENSHIDLVIYRLTVDNITQALFNKFQAGVPVRLLLDLNQYRNKTWPEYWLTHANIDKLWAEGVPIEKNIHSGVTHMKTLITSTYATNASSNFAAAWQRDDDYFVSAATKPTIYQALADRVDAMWNDTNGFAPFTPDPPDAATLASPSSGATNISTSTSLTWNLAAFAVNYDVYLGTSQSNMAVVGNVAAVLSNTPPTTYSWTPASALQPGTTYFWKVVSRTNATPVNPSLIATSSTQSFTTAGSVGPPAAPTGPTPSDGAIGVGTSPTLGWSSGAIGTTYNISFGTTNPPPQVATGLTNASYQPGALAADTTYFWRVMAVTNGGSTAGALWSFTTGSGGGTATDIVIYASDVATVAGAWSKASDSSAAAGIKLTNPDNGGATVNGPLAAPADYLETTFDAQAGTRYRVWLRIHAIDDSKLNDSVFVQFSDSVDSGNNPTYRIGTTGGYAVNLWACATCQSFGWGWQRNAYWLPDTGDVFFQNTGTHTIRVQIREDGAEIDQIVISPTTYATNPPGPVSNDTTIVPKPAVLPGAPSSPSPANGATGVSPSATLSWTASDATSYDVNFGTSNPPPQVATGISAASYSPSMTTGVTYYWSIVAHNSQGATSGAVWTFATAAAPPPPPATPNSPTPTDGASDVSTNVTMTWSAAGAATYDISFGTANPPPLAASGMSSASYTPSALAAGTTYFWQVVARNAGGSTSGPIWSFATATAPPPADDIVIYASDVAPAALHGAWTTASDPTSPNGVKLVTPDNGVADTNNALAVPTDYVDVTFGANANTPYRIWLRMQALGNSKYNDSLWVQFSDAMSGGSAVYPIGSTAGLDVNLATDAGASSLNGWGWQNGAYWLTQATTVTFPTTGTHTLRIQTREDGAELDQIVLSPSTYLNAAPGPASGDSTIVPKPAPPSPPAAPNSPTPADTATNVGTSPTLSWSASGATSYDVFFGTGNPPPQVTTGQGGSAYSPSPLSDTTAYYWQVVAHNGAGDTTGPVWSFTTGAPPPPPPPSTPGSPAPADTATGVSTSPTLSWSAAGAASYDVFFDTGNPPAEVSAGQAGASYTPATLANSTTYFWQIVAHNGSGTTSGPVWSFTTAAPAPPPPTDVVIYASDVPPASMHGSWSASSDGTSPNGIKLVTTDAGVSNAANALATPTDFVDVTFSANANTPYTIWLRLQALGNSKYNDSLWAQFSDAMSGSSSVYPINSTSGLLVNLATDAGASSLNGWGWQNSAYWLTQPTTVTFATTGTHTLRIQVREDGVELDQIVLSPNTYLTAPPGPVTNDSTIVPK